MYQVAVTVSRHRMTPSMWPLRPSRVKIPVGMAAILPPTETLAARRAWLRPAGLLVLLTGVLVLSLTGALPENLSVAGLRSALDKWGMWAPAGLLAVFALRPLALIPITPFWVLSGTLFGWLEGALWATVGTSLGAGIGFAIARFLGRDLVERRLGARARRWSGLARADGFRTVLALQLTPVVPHDLINSLAGVSRMAYRSFFLGSLLGTIPIIGVYAYIGDAVWAIPSAPFWVAMGLLTALTITMLWWNRRRAVRRRNRS